MMMIMTLGSLALAEGDALLTFFLLASNGCASLMLLSFLFFLFLFFPPIPTPNL